MEIWFVIVLFLGELLGFGIQISNGLVIILIIEGFWNRSVLLSVGWRLLGLVIWMVCML